MMQFLRRLTARLWTGRTGASAAGHSRRVPLCVEVLEDREVPSTFTAFSWGESSLSSTRAIPIEQFIPVEQISPVSGQEFQVDFWSWGENVVRG